jgi:nitrite reductase/ring-hydroxylating ferredoxin subunit
MPRALTDRCLHRFAPLSMGKLCDGSAAVQCPYHGLRVDAAGRCGEFIALAKRRPGQLNYASSGVGSTNHVMTERLKSLAGIDLVHVPFRGGAPSVLADTVAREVAAYRDTVSRLDLDRQ